jgi:hypothetical protein
MLSWLVESGFEKVTLDRVHVDLDVGSPNRWLITGVEVEVNGGSPVSGPVCVERGDQLTVFVALDSVPGQGQDTAEIQIRVPRRFGALNIRGGNGLDPFMDPGEFDGLDGLLRKLRQSSPSDELVARIVKDGGTQARRKKALNRVIDGSATVRLLPPSAPGC